jgi:hypothetical protein
LGLIDLIGFRLLAQLDMLQFGTDQLPHPKCSCIVRRQQPEP